MTLYETDLPGVGKKFEIELDGGERLVIVTHNTGKREVFIKPEEDADSDRLFELSDKLARTVGSVLEGAYFQPVASDRIETMLADETYLEWYNVSDDAELAGQTLSEADVRARFGVSVIAIQREDDLVPSPSSDTRIEAGDTLVVVGKNEECLAFEEVIESRDP